MKLQFINKKIDEDLSRVILFDENENCPCTKVEVNTCPKTNLCPQGDYYGKLYFQKDRNYRKP